VAFFTIIGDYSYAMDTMDKTYLGVVLLAIYALISQIMLVNLLIAMMGDTYSDVKDNSDKEWRFYRYVIVYEYKTNSSLPPPFNLLVGPILSVYEWVRDQKKASNYLVLSEGTSFQKSSPAHPKISEVEMSTMKKMKMGKDKLLEKEEEMDRASLKVLSVSFKEQLRVMSSQRDSDRRQFEQQLKSLKDFNDRRYKEVMSLLTKALEPKQKNP